MTLLASHPKPMDSTPASDSTPTAETGAELRMLEKRSKVIEELLQTEKDYIKDLQMCVKEIIEPLQKKQVGAERVAQNLNVCLKKELKPAKEGSRYRCMSNHLFCMLRR